MAGFFSFFRLQFGCLDVSSPEGVWLWFGCEMQPLTPGTVTHVFEYLVLQLVALLGRLWNLEELEEVGHCGWDSTYYSLAPLPV